MKKSKLLLFAVMISFFAFTKCNKEENQNNYLNGVPQDKYYDAEIFSEQTAIYGLWQLIRMHGGIAGQDIEPTYNFLQLKPHGIYGIVDNENLTEYGKVLIIEDNDGNLDISLQAEGSNENQHYKNFLVLQPTIDSLELHSHDFDGISHFFKRVQTDE